MNLAEARNVTFSYGHDEVIRDVSISLRRGELTGLIGPNGSGKSTLVKLLSGFAAPRQGVVLFEGRRLSEWNRRLLARRMAVVEQEFPVEFPFSVYEFVLMGRHPHLGPLQFETEQDHSVARKALEMLDIVHLRDRGIHEISGGERQRAQVARALAQEPVCLLMDEPTAFLDLRHQLDLFSMTRRMVGEKGLGALVISHDVNLAAQFCDRLILLNRGRVVAGGAPEEVVSGDILGDVYGCRMVVEHSSVTGTPRIIPLEALGN